MVYTDGSLVQEKIENEDEDDENPEEEKREPKVGCGFVVMKCDENEQKEEVDYGCYHLQDHNSVYQAETTAMHRAVMHLLKTRRGELPRRIYLLTDSKSLVQALKGHQHDKKTVNNLVTSLNLLGAYDQVRIRWVKAHAQCAGNNRADEIARCGAQPKKAEEAGLDCEEITDIPAPYTYLRKKVREGIENLWTEKWANELYPDGRPKYRQTRHWFPKPDKAKSYDLVRNDRETIGKCMQFITGHAHMNRHQNLMDSDAALRTDEEVEITSPTCRLCHKGEETPYHLVLECEEMAEDSRKYLKEQPPERDKRYVRFNWKALKLIQFLATPTLDPLFGVEEREVPDENGSVNSDQEDAPAPTSDDDGNRDDGEITMRDIWNRPLNKEFK